MRDEAWGEAIMLEDDANLNLGDSYSRDLILNFLANAVSDWELLYLRHQHREVKVVQQVSFGTCYLCCVKLQLRLLIMFDSCSTLGSYSSTSKFGIPVQALDAPSHPARIMSFNLSFNLAIQMPVYRRTHVARLFLSNWAPSLEVARYMGRRIPVIPASLAGCLARAQSNTAFVFFNNSSATESVCARS